MGFIFQLANAHELAPRCMMQSFTVTTRKSRYPSQKSPNRGPHPLSAARVTLYPPRIMAQSSMAGGFYVMTRVPPVVESQTTTKGVFSLSIFCFLVLKQHMSLRKTCRDPPSLKKPLGKSSQGATVLLEMSWN